MQKKNIHTNSNLTLGSLTLPVSVRLSSQRRRTITLKVDEHGLVIFAPLRTADTQLQDFMRKQEKWILRQVEALEQKKQKQVARKFVTGEHVPYLGGTYMLCVKENEQRRLGPQIVQIVADTLEIVIQAYDEEVQRKQAVVKALIAWYRRQALEKVQQRIVIWQQLLGVTPAKLKITQALKRWGSCSSKNNICISWQVVLLPLPLLDYIIVHELCHIVHKNHSVRFWDLVAQVMPDYRERDKAINRQSMLILSEPSQKR